MVHPGRRAEEKSQQGKNQTDVVDIFFHTIFTFYFKVTHSKIALVESEIQVQPNTSCRFSDRPSSRHPAKDCLLTVETSGSISTVVGPQCHIVAGHIKAETFNLAYPAAPWKGVTQRERVETQEAATSTAPITEDHPGGEGTTCGVGVHGSQLGRIIADGTILTQVGPPPSGSMMGIMLRYWYLPVG
jgi:hypothetical protein